MLIVNTARSEHLEFLRSERRLADIRDQLQQRGQALVEPEQVRRALAAFDPMWDRLPPDEQVRLIKLLVERVDFDGSAGTVAVTFSPTGLAALAREQNHGVAA